jgi:hypothetical protein
VGDRPSSPGGAVRRMTPDDAPFGAASGAACRMKIASSSLMDFAAAPGSIAMLNHALGRRAGLAHLRRQYRAAIPIAA